MINAKLACLLARKSVATVVCIDQSITEAIGLVIAAATGGTHGVYTMQQSARPLATSRDLSRPLVRQVAESAVLCKCLFDSRDNSHACTMQLSSLLSVKMIVQNINYSIDSLPIIKIENLSCRPPNRLNISVKGLGSLNFTTVVPNCRVCRSVKHNDGGR